MMRRNAGGGGLLLAASTGNQPAGKRSSNQVAIVGKIGGTTSNPPAAGNGWMRFADEETMALGHLEPGATPEHLQELEAERKKLRRLQIMIDMVMSVIAQDPKLSLEEATQMANDAKRAALAMFPDKELAFDLLYKPRLQRLLRERYRII
jgi:hypothetical protein